MTEREQAAVIFRSETYPENRRSDLLSDVVEQCPDGVYVFEAAPAGSMEWRLLYTNAAFRSMYGSAPASGRLLLDFLGSFLMPHDLAQTAASLQNLKAFRTPPIRSRRSREPLWIETNFHPKIEADRVLWFAVARNVTDASELQRRLLHLSRALDQAHEAIAISVARRQTWRIEYVNRAFTDVLGYAPEDVIGRGWRHLLMHDADRKKFEDYRVGLLSGQRVQAELEFRRKSGVRALLSLSTTPFRGQEYDNSQWTVTTLRDVTELRSEQQSLRELALRDPLTSLHNRREFERVLQAAVSMTPPQTRAHVLMFLDLDDFKVVNDLEGHDAGDRVLIAVAQTLRRTLLPSDDLARWGGDEFAAILYFCSPAQAVKRGKEIIDALASSPECRGVGASIGVVRIDSSAGVVEIMRRADRLVYEAKAAGRNRVVADNGAS